MSALDELITEFAKLPGVGRKTATRLTYFLLKQPKEAPLRLASTIERVAELVGPCTVCGNLSEADPCEICEDPRRDASLLCVVENHSMEGEATATLVRGVVSDPDVRVSRIALGLPVGGDLEYADAVTIAHSLSARREMMS